MSFAFILYCLWVGAVAAIRLAPAALRPRLRFAVLSAAILPVGLALFTVGFVPGVLAFAGVVALFPVPMTALGRYLVAVSRPYLVQARARLTAALPHRAA